MMLYRATSFRSPVEKYRFHRRELLFFRKWIMRIAREMTLNRKDAKDMPRMPIRRLSRMDAAILPRPCTPFAIVDRVSSPSLYTAAAISICMGRSRMVKRIHAR